MVNAFDFATSGRIFFARGASAELRKILSSFGSRPLVITGGSGRHGDLVDAVAHFAVASEPTVSMIRDGVDLCRNAACDVVVGVGGGSVIDAAKAIAALAPNPGDVLDYLEVIGRGQTLQHSPIPCVAVPATAGTGSEVTRNAVIGSPDHGVKASLRSPAMIPRVALVDPNLTLDLPPQLTASTGLDALTQLIEPYVSSKRNAMTDMFCREGLTRVARSLRHAYHQGGDIEARTDMCFASLLGGLSLANAGLGVVHGFAAPIGGMFKAPHGAVCAAVLPHGIAINIDALRERDPDSDALARYNQVGEFLTGYREANAALEWIRELCAELRVPALSAYGITPEHTGVLACKAAEASSMRANPIVLTQGELEEVLRRAL